MALVSGFFNTTQFGRGVSSVGDDVAQIGIEERRLANQRELMSMREQRDRELLELKSELGLIRGARRAGSGGGGGSLEDTPEEVQAAITGQSSVPAFRQTRDFFRTGEAPKDLGFPADKTPSGEGPGESGVSIDQPAARAGLEDSAKRYRSGLVEQHFIGKNKDLQESKTTARERELTLDAKDMDTAIAGGRKVAASKGQPEFDVKDGTRLNKYTGDTQTTEVGKSGMAVDQSTRTKNLAEASKDARTDPNKGTEEAKRKERREIENAITQTENTLRNYEQQNKFMKAAKKDPSGEEAATLARLRTRINDLNNELREMGVKPKVGEPKPAAPAAARAPYPDGTRLRGKDGKTYVVKDGKPVPEGK